MRREMDDLMQERFKSMQQAVDDLMKDFQQQIISS